MRILVFYQYFGTPKGGWSTRIYEMSRRWVERGNQVTVVTSPYEKSDISAEKMIERQQVDGIDLIVLNFPDSNRYSFIKRIYNFIAFSLLSIWFALREPADILLASSGPITVGIPVLSARLLRRKKYVFEIRDLWPHGAIVLGVLRNKLLIRLAHWFEKRCYAGAECVVTASPGMAEVVRKTVPEKCVETVTNASDNHLFGKRTGEELPSWVGGKPIILHFGSLGLIHNCIQLIEGVKFLERKSRDSFWLLFIGEGAERSFLEAKVREYNLNNVRFLGLMPKEDLIKWVENSVATVLTTLDNPVQNTCSPNKVFDSFAAGIPVIQTTTGWLKELFEKEQCGINVEPNNPESMAKAIERVLEDKEYRDNLAVNAKRVAQEFFDRDRLSDKYLKILETVVRK